MRTPSAWWRRPSRQFGAPDILVNNAGVYEFAPLDAITAEHFHRQFNINVLGLLQVTQEAAKHFPAKGGSIINISSVVSTLSLPGSSVYAATKAAVDTITRVLSQELGGRKIRVNSINPGMIETEGARSQGIIGSDFEKNVLAQTPWGGSASRMMSREGGAVPRRRGVGLDYR